MDGPRNPLDGNSPTVEPGTPVSAPTGPASPPVFGRYEVRRSLGAGGFGEVYLAHDTLLDRLVALKVLRARSVQVFADGDPALHEARKLAKLHHPGIVAVHDVGVHAGQLYVVSDYVDGPDLGRWLRDHRPPWSEAAGIVAAVADALSHAHGRLIVHRDVKPANIILTADRAPVLVDFGLALDEAQAGSRREGPCLRDAVVHVARTGAGDGASHRRPHRRVQPGGGPLRTAHRPRAVPGHGNPAS